MLESKKMLESKSIRIRQCSDPKEYVCTYKNWIYLKKNRIDEKFFWMKQNIETKPCYRKGKRNLRRIKKIAKQSFKLWIQLSLVSVHAMKKQNSEMHRSWLYDWLNDGIIIYKWIEALNWINRWHLDGINKRSDKNWISVCLS